MTESTYCESEYDSEIGCELKKGHKGHHQYTKYWSDE